jgi:transposase InsO family protein
MSRAISPSVMRPYGVVRVCEEWDVARSTFYARRAEKAPAAKRGPKTAHSDEDVITAMRQVIEESPFTGEGHRKVRAQLRSRRGIRIGRPRCLRLMREAKLQPAPIAKRTLGPRHHDGTITTDRPDEMWGTDATGAFTLEEGQVTVFVAVDHCTMECVGIHAAKYATRFEALEPIRQGVRRSFGGYGEKIALGLALRHDHGSQFMSRDYQDEIRFLGIASTPSYVRSPEGNGCAERFIRTLKEQLLWTRWFRNVEELLDALHAWVKTYNAQWMVEKHGHRAPSEIRARLIGTRDAA